MVFWWDQKRDGKPTRDVLARMHGTNLSCPGYRAHPPHFHRQLVAERSSAIRRVRTRAVASKKSILHKHSDKRLDTTVKVKTNNDSNEAEEEAEDANSSIKSRSSSEVSWTQGDQPLPFLRLLRSKLSSSNASQCHLHPRHASIITKHVDFVMHINYSGSPIVPKC